MLNVPCINLFCCYYIINSWWKHVINLPISFVMPFLALGHVFNCPNDSECIRWDLKIGTSRSAEGDCSDTGTFVWLRQSQWMKTELWIMWVNRSIASRKNMNKTWTSSYLWQYTGYFLWNFPTLQQNECLLTNRPDYHQAKHGLDSSSIWWVKSSITIQRLIVVKWHRHIRRDGMCQLGHNYGSKQINGGSPAQ